MTKRILSVTTLLLAVNLIAAEGELKSPLRSGPMLGYSEMTETAVWLQTREPALTQIRYWKIGDPASSRLSEVIETRRESDFIARFILGGLDPGSRYEYELYLDSKRVPLPAGIAFQTQKLWQWRTDPPSFRFAVGSCAYINDPPFDRPGTPYGANMEIFETIANQKPDFMVWLGDNVYYREADWSAESSMRYRYAHDRSLPQLQRLLATTHHYATWDDHDYGPNDSDRTFPLKETSLRIFKDYWANPSYGQDHTPGVFGRFVWGDAEFFLLDDRYHRSPNKMPVTAGKVMFGEAQMRWLMESLRSSNATFKIVVSGNQVMNPTQLDSVEQLLDFPAERDTLLNFLRSEKISGVLFLSGDKHQTELIRLPVDDLYPLYDLTISPLTAGTYFDPKEPPNPVRVDGTLVHTVRNFAILEISGPAKQRALSMTVFDPAGAPLWKRTLRASELAPAAGN
jgi:alkaline phosphatase D